MRRSRILLTALASVTALAITTVGPAASGDADDEIPPASLLAGQALVAESDHDKLSNGPYTLTVSSGFVELDEYYEKLGSTTGSWFADGESKRIRQHDRTRLVLRRNGDLVLLTERGQRMWHTGTKGSGAVRLTVHRGGNLALHTESGRVVWATHSGKVFLWAGQSLKPGQRLVRAWGTHRPGWKLSTLTMHRNGNLVHRCGKKVTWQSRTHVRGSSLRLYRNGALRILGPKGGVVWTSRSGGHRRIENVYLAGGSLYIHHGSDIIWSRTPTVC